MYGCMLDETVGSPPSPPHCHVTAMSLPAPVGLCVGLCVCVQVTRLAVQAVPLEGIELAVRSVDLRRIRELLSFLAAELVSDTHTHSRTHYTHPPIHTYPPSPRLGCVSPLGVLPALVLGDHPDPRRHHAPRAGPHAGTVRYGRVG